jgi:hypothetical protein
MYLPLLVRIAVRSALAILTFPYDVDAFDGPTFTTDPSPMPR